MLDPKQPYVCRYICTGSGGGDALLNKRKVVPLRTKAQDRYTSSASREARRRKKKHGLFPANDVAGG